MPTVEIPVPPSANQLWKAVSTKNAKVRLIKQKAYAGWLTPAVFLLRAGLPRFTGPVRVDLLIRGGKGFPERRDIDNCLKAVLDALRHADRIPDDTVKVVTSASARYESPAANTVLASCLVTVDGAEVPHPALAKWAGFPDFASVRLGDVRAALNGG